MILSQCYVFSVSLVWGGYCLEANYLVEQLARDPSSCRDVLEKDW